MNDNTFFRCISCLTPSTRPRITFDENQICSACNFANKKKSVIDWESRKLELHKICDKYRKNNGDFDVLVPGGGGKDSSYVAWMLKNEFKMNPLCVCAVPPLPTEIGSKNLSNFSASGFNILQITPNLLISKQIAKNAFIKYGQPQLDWLYSIFSVPLKISTKMNIPFIMYGEEAESEYGGATELEKKPNFNLDHIFKFYYSGIDLHELIDGKHSKSDLEFLTLPSKDELERINIFPAHWSYFEKWDEDMHLKLAEEKCGLLRSNENTSGPNSSFSHLDHIMYFLHMYLAYLKFGFGRATADASIDIKMGKISTEEAKKIIKEYDHIFPNQYLQSYLTYFDMTEQEFWSVCESHRNKDIFELKDKEYILKDSI
tara:strand:+ start:1575 stop:2693 length:1119 start_codon:yes stop_codon:yes gene_type:complete